MVLFGSSAAASVCVCVRVCVCARMLLGGGGGVSTCGAAFEESLLLRLRSIRRTVLREARCSASHSATDYPTAIRICRGQSVRA
jgi:hypothetical protein